MSAFITLIKKFRAGFVFIFALSLFIVTQSLAGPGGALLAFYPLLANTSDATANYGNMTLSGNPTAPTVNNGVCLNGIYIAFANGQNAQTPNISTLTPTDFHISVDFNVSQYNTNYPGAPVIMGGDLYRWIGIWISPTGTIGVEYNNSNFSLSTTTVTTGTWHTATLSYVGGIVQLFLDGTLILNSSIGALTNGGNYDFTTNNFGNGRAFNGCIRNLGIFNGNVNVSVFTLSVNATHGSVTVSPNQPYYGANATVQLSPIPDSKFYFSGWSGDVPSGHERDNPLTLTMDTNKTVTAAFDTVGEYKASYRTATYEDWALSFDANGKRASAKRKTDKDIFDFIILADTARPLSLDFGMKVNAIVTYKRDIIHFVERLTDVQKLKDSLASVAPGDTIFFAGTGEKGKKLVAKYSWGKKKAVTLKADSLYIVNHTGLPEPNLVNVGEELFPKGFDQTTPYFLTGLTLGIPQGTKGANSVHLKKYGDVLTMLAKKGKAGFILDTANVRCLDSLGKKAISKQLGATGPDKYQNKLLAEALALKLNIAASTTQKFPVGLSNLVYDDPTDTTNPFRFSFVNRISSFADSMLSCLPLQAKPTATLGELYTVLRKINVAFADSPYTIDTLSFAAKTQLTGVKKIFDVSYLLPPPVEASNNFSGDATFTNNTPKEFALYQNYPNPFNPTTTLSFAIGNQSMVNLKVYNILGQEIATLIDHEEYGEGNHEVQFNANNFASGVYFYRITAQTIDNKGIASTFTDVKRMLLIK